MSRRSGPTKNSLPDHALTQSAIAALKGEQRVYLVKAPPGSGKTTLLLGVLRELRSKRKRLAVATQTNSQADDLCARWVEYGLGPITRLVAGDDDASRPAGVTVITGADNIRDTACIVVATAAKWGWTSGFDPFDVLFVDEAWQMPWATFATLPHVAGNFMLIGDPGQIQPIVTVDTSRWDIAPVPPHRPAPEVLLQRQGVSCGTIAQTFRLPSDTVELVRGFYDFAFDAVAKAGARKLLVDPGAERGPVADVLAQASTSSIVAATRRMPSHGSVPNDDPEIAFDAAQIVRHLLDRKAQVEIDGDRRLLTADDIGVVATHRVMLSIIRDYLRAATPTVTVETPERWQGLQRPVMVAVHPLSATRNPAAFDLATGRLCVMASRHQVALVVVSRDHVADTLVENLPDATQAPSKPDDVGRGHAAHSRFWRALQHDQRAIRLG
jgi:hypothetical protein